MDRLPLYLYTQCINSCPPNYPTTILLLQNPTLNITHAWRNIVRRCESVSVRYIVQRYIKPSRAEPSMNYSTARIYANTRRESVISNGTPPRLDISSRRRPNLRLILRSPCIPNTGLITLICCSMECKECIPLRVFPESCRKYSTIIL